MVVHVHHVCRLLILQIAKHIFTGPSSAMQTKPGGNNTRPCNAKIHSMTQFTGRHIAYAVVQVHTFYSSLASFVR
jgi:hypothetical protein